jgi:threonine dehydrogenase-like Zn-dependent dehydrogenase
MYGAGDVRIEAAPDASLIEPTDALVVVTRAAICGSDLWPYQSMAPSPTGRHMGHEAIGVVEAVGADVRTIRASDVVIMPFPFSDGTCIFCHEGLHTSCLSGGFFGTGQIGGAQAEAVRVPQADGTLVALLAGASAELMPSLLTLSDVMATGHHAAVVARVGPGKSVAVVGDGAVGLCGVLAARRLGADQIILLGRHADRIALAREFGATNIVRERGPRGVRTHGAAHRPPRWRRRPRGGPPGRKHAGVTAGVLQQRLGGRRASPSPRVHRGAAAGRARRPH